MPKIVVFDNSPNGPKDFMFDCPGCGFGHHVAIEPHQFGNGASWTWNGNLESPTFTPSVLSTIEFTVEGKPSRICHLFVKDGKLEFLGDCTHKFAGQTVEMPEVDI
jgi:hypothetical protein